MQDDRRGGGILAWVALAVPGMFAGVGWAATEGWPLPNRLLAGVAAGLVVYAVLHVAINGVKRNGRRGS